MCQLCSTAWEVCPSCRGAGLQDGMYGPVMCYECKGNSMVRIRDERGRFTTRPTGAIVWDWGHLVRTEQCVAYGVLTEKGRLNA